MAFGVLLLGYGGEDGVVITVYLEHTFCQCFRNVLMGDCWGDFGVTPLGDVSVGVWRRSFGTRGGNKLDNDLQRKSRQEL